MTKNEYDVLRSFAFYLVGTIRNICKENELNIHQTKRGTWWNLKINYGDELEKKKAKLLIEYINSIFEYIGYGIRKKMNWRKWFLAWIPIWGICLSGAYLFTSLMNNHLSWALLFHPPIIIGWIFYMAKCWKFEW